MITIDYKLFEFLNGTLHNSFFDSVMPVITDSSNVLYGSVAMLVLYLILQKKKKEAFILAFFSLIAFALADAVAYRILKPFFGRARPCNPAYFIDGANQLLTEARFLIGTKGSFSLPSNHASNMFAQATYWSLLYPKWGKILYPVAIFITYTRVYVGVHYPFDLFLGAVLGAVAGLFAYMCVRKIPIALPAEKQPKAG